MKEIRLNAPAYEELANQIGVPPTAGTIKLGDLLLIKRYVPPDGHTQEASLMERVMGGLDRIFNGPAKGVEKKLGLVLLVFPYGAAKGRTNYISNGADRKDMVLMFKELSARFEGQPDIIGHA